jgi:hypothetical protein
MRKLTQSASAALFAAIYTCSHAFAWVILVGSLAAIGAYSPPTSAQAPGQFPAQDRPIPIPEKAEFAKFTMVPGAGILINGQQDRLSPGARIVGQNNLLVLPGTLQGDYAVRYLRDVSGLVHQVWILTEKELAQVQQAQSGTNPLGALFNTLFGR